MFINFVPLLDGFLTDMFMQLRTDFADTKYRLYSRHSHEIIGLKWFEMSRIPVKTVDMPTINQ